MTSRKRVLIIAVILVGALLVARTMIALRPEPPRRPPEPDTPIVSVETAVRGEGAIVVFGSGTVRPRAEIDVASEVGGKIAWTNPNFQSGGRVRAGEILVRIDPSDYQNRVEQARADVAAQQVGVLQAEEEARIAREEYDQFALRDTLRAGRGSEPSALALRQPQLDAARAALARAEAGLADAVLALGRTEVTSPFEGRVRMESANIGAFVGPGQSLGRIYASDAVEVVVPIADDDAVQIQGLWALEAGDGVRSIRALVRTTYGDRSFAWDGYVDRAETALDEQSRTIDIVVRVPDPFQPGRPIDGAALQGTAPPLLVGQFASVEIDGLSPDVFFVLPRRSLRPGNEVWAVGSDDRVQIVQVDVLQETDEDLFVTGDLEDGQAVIVGGINLATQGMKVRVASRAGARQ